MDRWTTRSWKGGIAPVLLRHTRRFAHPPARRTRRLCTGLNRLPRQVRATVAWLVGALRPVLSRTPGIDFAGDRALPQPLRFVNVDRARRWGHTACLVSRRQILQDRLVGNRLDPNNPRTTTRSRRASLFLSIRPSTPDECGRSVEEEVAQLAAGVGEGRLLARHRTDRDGWDRRAEALCGFTDPRILHCRTQASGRQGITARTPRLTQACRERSPRTRAPPGVRCVQFDQGSR